MPKAVKNSYLEGVFGMTIFGDVYKIAKQDFNEIKKNIESLISMTDEFHTDIAQLKEKQEGYLDSIKAKEDAYKAKIKKYKLDIIDLEKSKIKEVQNVEHNEVQIKEIVADYEDGIRKLDKAVSETNTKIKQLGYKKEELEKSISKYDNIIDKVCDDCTSILDQCFNLTESANKITKINDAIKKLKGHIGLDNEKLISCKSKLDAQRPRLLEINNVKKQNLKIEQQNNNIQHKISTNKNSIEIITEELNSLTTDDPFIELIKEKTEKRTSAVEKLKSISEKKDYLDYVLNIYSESGVKKYIVSNVIEILNARIKGYLSQMGADFTVIFDTSFNYDFFTNSGKTEYFLFSSGERARIDFAVLFALREVMSSSGFSANIFIVDEVLDGSLDTFGLLSVLNLLKDMSREESKSIVVISHREAITEDVDIFNHVVCVEKEFGITKFIQEN
jgi:DNA repair exonuclease SbcCD ATPase subunit